MVKKKVGGGKRFKAAQSKGSGNEHLKPSTPQPPPPKHLQRKITRKVGFLDKVASSQPVKLRSGLGATPIISKHQSAARRKQKASKALSNLQSLSGTLSEVEQELQQQLPSKLKKDQQQQRRQFGQAVNSSRAREAVMVQESGRMQQVLKHPIFKANPLQAITNHLKATLPAAPPPESQSSAARTKQQLQQKKKKAKAKAKAAGSGGAGDMEM
uniref:Ribosome biogenesis protein SLX9 n=1 Tax=Dunaliella tertiolecta TaxID=3047 RepID=A0A7S3QWC8_DUNTE|mmetsp:Transcript_3116/g.8239  ORF Transcript_3116/g.8239 Transcript_3116/m.8239 type:complete len:213 (-) Transcript_3116:106-744(-)